MSTGAFQVQIPFLSDYLSITLSSLTAGLERRSIEPTKLIPKKAKRIISKSDKIMIYSGSTPINLDNPRDLPFSFSAHVLPPLQCLPPRAQNQEKSLHWKEKHCSVSRNRFRPILRRWEEQSVGVRHLLGRPRQCQLQYLPEHLFGGFYLFFPCVTSKEFFY